MPKIRRCLIVDHFDSFTYNLYQSIGEMGVEVTVLRTNQPLAAVIALAPTHIVLSPGPGHPADVPLFQEVIQYFRGSTPILGVCLGHQAIGLSHGASVIRNHRLMHGKQSEIRHNSDPIFAGISKPFLAGRYHSLVIPPEDCPAHGLEVIAWTHEREVMAVRSGDFPLTYGVQFHPESILTPEGKRLLQNFLTL